MPAHTLANITPEGQSADYDLLDTEAWAPFDRTALYSIPDAIFEQYNQTECHTIMGLFAPIGQAWMAVDNRLYLWDYTTQKAFQGYEQQPHNITCVKLLKPKPGVFIDAVNYVLLIGTTMDIILLGIQATPSAGGDSSFDVQIFETKMVVPTKGIDVSVIEGTASGRVFFGGRNDNDLYEFTYQENEGWFHGRSGKVCHTGQAFAAFAPKLPFLTKPHDSKFHTVDPVDNV